MFQESMIVTCFEMVLNNVNKTPKQILNVNQIIHVNQIVLQNFLKRNYRRNKLLYNYYITK